MIFIHEHIHGEEIFPYRSFYIKMKKEKKKTRLPPKQQRFPSIRVSRSNWATESVGPNGA